MEMFFVNLKLLAMKYFASIWSRAASRHRSNQPQVWRITAANLIRNMSCLHVETRMALLNAGTRGRPNTSAYSTAIWTRSSLSPRSKSVPSHRSSSATVWIWLSALQLDMYLKKFDLLPQQLIKYFPIIDFVIWHSIESSPIGQGSSIWHEDNDMVLFIVKSLNAFAKYGIDTP